MAHEVGGIAFLLLKLGVTEAEAGSSVGDGEAAAAIGGGAMLARLGGLAAR